MPTASVTPAGGAPASTATGERSDASPAARSRSRLGARVRTGQVVLTVLFVLSGVIALSTLFATDPFEHDAVVLIASFGALGAVLGVAGVWGGVGSRLVRIAFWALPLFFAWHIAALGTWMPDAVLGVIAGIGAALVTGAGRSSVRDR